jgi:hypothetical protein
MPDASPQSDRRWILLSHANPEDNAATVWFATQLANEGYRVWSDMIDLAGGEDFWGGIEEVIRNRAAKVVYLLSPASNAKEGCLRELSLAQGVAKAGKLKDFVIPLRIADLKHNDANIRIHPLNILESRSWNLGLAALLAKLQQDAVPRGVAKDFRATSSWWKARFATSRSVLHEPEALSSNWFRVENPKLTVHCHRLGTSEVIPAQALENFPWPAFANAGGLWTFAPPDAVVSHLPPSYRIERTVVAEIAPGGDFTQSERDATFRLFLLAWHAELERRGLLKYELANAKYCFAFPQGLIDGDEVHFRVASGRKGYRSMVGYKTRINSQGELWKRFWHFAIQPVPAFWPELVVTFRTHVLFSEDGETLWQSANRVQKARRNQCKNWWNDTWRDRLQAAVSWLAAGGDSIRLDVGASDPITLSSESAIFESPVTYLKPASQVHPAVSAPSEDDAGGDEDSNGEGDDEVDDNDDDDEGEPI